MSDKGKKVYSPDITTYSFEGTDGVSRTFAYAIVAPFRIVSRVMHNICILPADLSERYADGLLIIATIMSVLGLIDLFVFHKWVLIVSQLPLFPIAFKMRNSARIAIDQQAEDPIIDVDKVKVTEMATEVYDELDKIL